MASVTPPLNTAAPVPNLPFFSITPSMLTSSSATEVASWAAGTTYALDALVKDPATHYEYKSLIAGNVGNDPALAANATKWQLQGASNKFRMFDLLRNDVTTLPSGGVVEITPGRRVDAIGAIGVNALSVLIEVVVSGVTVWSATDVLATRVVTNWFEYFYGDFAYKRKFGRFDLPQYTTAKVRLTFTGIGGADVTISRLVVGKQTYLGTMQYDAESDALNFSKNDRSDSGAAILIPKRSIPKIKADIRIPAGNVTTIQRLRDEDLNAVPALWSGVGDEANPYFEPLLTIGVYKQFPITMDRADTAIGRPEIEET